MASTMSKYYIKRHAFCTLFLVIHLLIVSHAVAKPAEEIQKCAEKLEGASTCLPYIQGDAKAPTSDCCNGLKDAIKNNHRCLCLMVIERNDPDLGLKYINITLALGLPSICKAPENLSQCPALLHLDPNSPEAQVFNQANRNYTGVGSSPPVSAKSFSSGKGTGTPAENKACYSYKRMVVPQILVAICLLVLHVMY